MSNVLNGQRIFVSASLPSDYRSPEFTVNREQVGWIEDAIIATARAVFGHGGRLVMGGHPSIVPLVAMVAGEYAGERGSERSSHIDIRDDATQEVDRALVDVFQSRAYERYLPAETSAMCEAGLANIHWVESRNNERFDPIKLGEPQCRESLRAMRNGLLTQAEPTAMVGIGGMEGLLEEFEMFSRICSGPVYLYRSTGGMARMLADKKFDVLRNDDLIHTRRAAQSTFHLDSLPRVSDLASLQRVQIVEFLARNRKDVRQAEGDWVEGFQAFRNERFAHVEDRKREALNPPYDFLANMMVEEIVGID